MQKLLRRLRGAIGMGITWGFAWSCAGFALAVITRFQADAPFPIIFGALGFLAGVVFSIVLTLSEGRRRFEQMSLPRFATGGAIGGLLLAGWFARMASLGAGDALIVVPTFALASAACAAGTLALARRAEHSALTDGSAARNAELSDRELRRCQSASNEGESRPARAPTRLQ